MSMINKTRLEEFANGLWAKIKQHVGNSIRNVTLDASNDILRFEKADGTTSYIDLNQILIANNISFNNTNTNLNLSTVQEVLEYLEKDKASITKDNLFEGINAFDNLFISDKDNFVGGNTTGISPAGGTKRMGRRDYTSHSNGNNGYVKSLKIRLSDGMGAGTTTRVSLWEVQKGTTHADDIPTQIINDSVFLIKEDTTWNKHIEIIINKQYENETYFIYEVIPTANVAYAPVQSGNNDVIYIDNMDVTSANINSSKGGSASAVYGLVGGNSIKDLLKSSGKVKTVNGQTPNEQGEITLNAGHFQDIYSKEQSDARFLKLEDVANQANKVPRLNAQGKLETSILPKIAINDTLTFTRNTQSEAETIAMQQTIENGDMMILIVGASTNNRVTKKYLCVDATQNTFAERFIELTFPTDGVTEGELNTALQRYVPVSDVGTGANQVLRLNAEGKIDDNNLKLATSEEINAIINALQ